MTEKTPTKTQKVNLDWVWNPKSLLLMIAVGEGVSLIYSSIVLDGHEWTNPLFFMSIMRGLMGLATSLAAAFSANELPKRGNKLGKRFGWGALGILIFGGVVVMATCSYGPPSGPFKVMASIGFALLPGAAALAISFASGHIFPDQPASQSAGTTEATAGQTAGSTKKQTKASQQTAPPVGTSPEAVAPAVEAAAPAETPPAPAAQAVAQPVASAMAAEAPCKWGCGQSGSKGWQNGHNAHCTHNPASKKYIPGSQPVITP